MPRASLGRFARALGELGQRTRRAAFDEVEQLYPGKVLATAITRFLPDQTFGRTRTAALRAAGVRIGERSLILGAVRLTGVGNPCNQLTIGEDAIITGPLHVDVGAPVHIGNRVQLGHDVTLLTVNHAIGDRELRSGPYEFGRIHIGDGTWIASRVIVLPGVAIGEGSVVAAGSVVTRDVPPDTLVAGVPARVVRNLSPGS